MWLFLVYSYVMFVFRSVAIERNATNKNIKKQSTNHTEAKAPTKIEATEWKPSSTESQTNPNQPTPKHATYPVTQMTLVLIGSLTFFWRKNEEQMGSK